MLKRNYKTKILFIVLITYFYGIKATQDCVLKPKIAIINLYDNNYKHIGQHSDWNKEVYAKKHNYDYILIHKILDPKRPASWSKILALEQYLDNYDWLFWSHADSLIMNDTIKLE